MITARALASRISCETIWLTLFILIPTETEIPAALCRAADWAAQASIRSLPAARAKGRALMLSGSAAARHRIRRLCLRRFSRPTASRQAACFLTLSAGALASGFGVLRSSVISPARETLPHPHLPRARPPAENRENQASWWRSGRSAPQMKCAPPVMSAWQSCRHPV
jgi:hypothetical protein